MDKQVCEDLVKELKSKIENHESFVYSANEKRILGVKGFKGIRLKSSHRANEEVWTGLTRLIKFVGSVVTTMSIAKDRDYKKRRQYEVVAVIELDEDSGL